MDTELKCDFYLGDRLYSPIKLMDYLSLKNFKGIVKFVPLIAPLYWQKGSVQLIFKSCYTNYIIDGEAYNLSNWAILFLGKLLGKKVYTWQHGWYGRESFLKKIIKKVQVKLAYHIFLYGDCARNLMLKENIPERKISCIYNSLDYDTHLKIRNQLDETDFFTNYFHNNNPVIIYTGRLQKVKRLDLLIDAIALLKKQNFLCNLVLVGEKADIFDLETLVKNYDSEQQVWFYGASYDEVRNAELFHNANVCVSPGNVGLTAIHAFSFGCPVITHDNFSKQMPEFEVITKGKTGDFFKENDAMDLALTIKKWLEYSADKKKEIAATCFAVIDEKWNPNYQIKIIKDVLLNKLKI
jgi:glycosyltransferase involved in cell wall biosynthesis